MTARQRPSRRPIRRQSGAVAIELAMVSLFLATLIMGTLDLARAMYAYTQIAQSTRAAARYLATSNTVSAAEVAKARNLVIYGSFVSTGDALTSELTAANTLIRFCSPSYCDITGKTNLDMTNQPVTGASTVNLVVVRVSNLTLVSYFPAVITNMLFRPIEVTFPRAG